MNKLNYIFSISLFLALWGCNSYESIIKFKPYKEKDYITKRLDIYEADKILFPVLDSIILRAERWSEYQELKTKIAFSFNTCKDYISGTEKLSPNPYILIGVIYNPRFYNYGEWTQGIFNYKGYNFYVDTIEYNILLHKTGRSTTISCIAPQKYQFEFHHRGDKDLYWWYEYRDEQIFNRH